MVGQSGGGQEPHLPPIDGTWEIVIILYLHEFDRFVYTVWLGCPELKEDIDVVMSFELRQTKVSVLILERQGMVKLKGFVTRFCRYKSASHRKLGPSSTFHLIEIVFSVENEL